MSEPTARAKIGKFQGKLSMITTMVVLPFILVVLPLIAFIVDYQWFNSIGFKSVFIKQLALKLGVSVAFFAFVALVVTASGLVAFKLCSSPDVHPDEDSLLFSRKDQMARSMKRGFIVAPVLCGVVGALIGFVNWSTVALGFTGGSFGQVDPQFHKDYGFYAFTLPLLNLVQVLWSIAIVFAFIVALGIFFLLGGIRAGSIGAGTRGTMSTGARAQLAILAGLFMLGQVFSYWLDRYSLLSKTHTLSQGRSSFTGGNYTDIHAVLPAKVLLMVIGIVVAIVFFATVVLKDLRIPVMATVLMLLSSLVIGVAWPAAVEQFQVIPNRAAKESEFIGRNIEATRYSFGLTEDKVNYEMDWGAKGATNEEVAADEATVSNIRLLDPQILAPTFTQREQLKNFYGFPSKLNMDRYRVDGELRDFVVAAREVNPTALTDNQKDWINRHTVYTHGNGLVVAPANKVDEVARDVGSTRGGYPLFIVSDLQTMERENANSKAEEIGIALKQPRIYYGPVIAEGPENQDYAIVGGTQDGRALEYDTDGSTYTYTGTGGVSIGNMAQRLLFALKFQELNMVLSDRIGDKSKILFNRDPRNRVEAVAPWLVTDSETYPTVVDGRMKWIVDGYTTLSSLPYSQPVNLPVATADPFEPTGNTQRRDVAYMRNSVKAVVDAYDGSVDLYAFDEEDPVLKAWRSVFPNSVRPKSEISEELMDHLRYPTDLFKVQRYTIAKYHVTDPQTFFTSDNFWSVPMDPTNERFANSFQPPYYVVAADPKTKEASFQLITPFRGFEREFLSAHMSVSSDPESFGQITLRILPTDTQTFGPAQAQDVMTSSDQVARDQTLWKATNDITNGNLLTLPVGGGEIMYVEPIYTKRRGQDSAFPKLLRVLVYYKGNLGYAPTIAEALSQVGIDPRAAADLDEATQLEGGTTPAVQTTDGETSDGAAADTPATLPTPPAAAADLGEALDRVNQAISNLNRAKNLSFEEYGKALDQLDRAVADYQRLQGITPAVDTPSEEDSTASEDASSDEDSQS